MTTNTSNNLSEYLSFEFKRLRSSNNAAPNNDLGTHALNQLIESKLGNEITLCAQRLAISKNNSGSDGDISSSELEEEVTKLMDSSAFQQIKAEIGQCPPTLLFPTNNYDDDATTTTGSNKKTKESLDGKPTTAAATAATSFSLFDLMDSQKGGGFMLPPRIMAHQVIDAYQRDNDNIMNNAPSSEDTNVYDDTNQSTTNNTKSALELLEQAEDMEDLSPDMDSWEEIRSILYHGLVNKHDDVEKQRRYFNVHKSLFDKCQKHSGGGMFRSQTWGLTCNIVGFILSLSNEFVNDETIMSDLDLYWDSCHHLRSSLSFLSMDYITSCVGNEKEIERMILGLCFILCSDISACILAMMEPLAGWLEVWTRFVGPSKLLAIVRCSGLGAVALRRCESRGRNEASKCLCEMLHGRDDDSSESPALEELENCNFVQSLSVLRLIASRCETKLQIVDSISSCNSISSFLSSDGIVSCDEVQTMLEQNESNKMEESVEEHQKITARLLKPFRDVLLLKESTPDLVDAHLEELCIQAASLIEQLN